MTKWHLDRGKKVTGGRVHQHRKKRRLDRGSVPLLTELGKIKKMETRGRGGTKKIKLVRVEYVNVTDPKTKKTQKVKIQTVTKHVDNPHYTRRNIITKGCFVKTDVGEVKITSRPSQDGVVNGVII